VAVVYGETGSGYARRIEQLSGMVR
jgi:hypothetical protein